MMASLIFPSFYFRDNVEGLYIAVVDQSGKFGEQLSGSSDGASVSLFQAPSLRAFSASQDARAAITRFASLESESAKRGTLSFRLSLMAVSNREDISCNVPAPIVPATDLKEWTNRRAAFRSPLYGVFRIFSPMSRYCRKVFSSIEKYSSRSQFT